MKANKHNQQEDLIERAFLALSRMPVPDGPPSETVATVVGVLAEAGGKPRTFSLVERIWNMKPIAKITTAAAACLIAVILVSLLTSIRISQPAYALEQTGEALKSVRYMHAVLRDDKAAMIDERWIELSPDGFQIRYRQEGGSLVIADDGEVCRVLHKDTNTFVLHDSGKYVWFGDLSGLLRDLSGKGEPGSAEIQRNVTYKGRPAHRVRLLSSNIDCYIDPASKLPMAIESYEISYGQPPKDIFHLAVPSGAKIVDLQSRPGVSQQPKEDQPVDDTETAFEAARYALVAKDFEKAEKLFAEVAQKHPLHNWAVFWLGRAQFEQANYNEAVRNFSKVIDMLGPFGLKPDYCYLTRGFAFQRKGLNDNAKKDFAVALPSMIKGLRNPKASLVFDYADDPLLQYRLIIRDRFSHERAVAEREKTSVPKMIERLRIVTGQNFGYDPSGTSEQNEKAIAAWEKWWADHAEEYGVKPEELKPYGQEEPAKEELTAAQREFIEKVYKLDNTQRSEASFNLFTEAKELKPSDAMVWFILGLSLYEDKHYAEALEAFGRSVELPQPQGMLSRSAYATIVWQGHMLDLLGRRDEAIERYKEGLKRYSGERVQHDNWGIWIDRKWIEECLKTPFDRK